MEETRATVHGPDTEISIMTRFLCGPRASLPISIIHEHPRATSIQLTVAFERVSDLNGYC